MKLNTLARYKVPKVTLNENNVGEINSEYNPSTEN